MIGIGGCLFLCHAVHGFVSPGVASRHLPLTDLRHTTGFVFVAFPLRCACPLTCSCALGHRKSSLIDGASRELLVRLDPSIGAGTLSPKSDAHSSRNSEHISLVRNRERGGWLAK